ncbi:MAG: MarR family transcriptional regulator [Bacteroidia bacterium]|nr:MarR family transcriptional regulator [Bacteroidia bacterium]
MKLEEEIKQKTFSSPYQKLILNVFVTSSWFGSESTRVLKPYKITLQQYNVLRILRGQQGKPASVGLIQERMLDKNSNASRLIDKLVLKKFVDRKPCPSDRRQMDIKITGKGLELLSILDTPMQMLDRELAERLSEEDALKVSDILDRVRG